MSSTTKRSTHKKVHLLQVLMIFLLPYSTYKKLEVLLQVISVECAPDMEPGLIQHYII